jgi:class 3 adenylate cyclase
MGPSVVVVTFDRYNSLEDFLASNQSHIDGVVNDGFDGPVTIKGREIEAAILFADISGFSTRTLNLTPAETLAFVQTFFAWTTAEALRGRPGVVDKYIGDELMVVFSTEFGSADPVADAISAAMDMSRRDVHQYRPHIGIAAGPVIVGQTGTPFRFNVSVFGAPVALAARCAGVRPADTDAHVWSSIVMPDNDWGSRNLADLLPDEPYPQFELREPRLEELKGVGEISVREIHNTSYRGGTVSTPEARAQRNIEFLRQNNRYWPEPGAGTTAMP